MTITIKPEEKKSELKELLAPVEWIWNPKKNTYGRVLFTISSTMLAEYLFYGKASWMINFIFIVIRISMSLGGNGWHLIFVLLKFSILAITYYSGGSLSVIFDLITGYFLNKIYFEYAGMLKKQHPQ